MSSRLLQGRIVMLGREIDDSVAGLIVAQLITLAKEDAEKEITLYVSSPGGSITSTLAIVDTLKTLGPDVSTFCMGTVAGNALLLLASGAPGRRLATREATVSFARPKLKAGLKVETLKELKKRNDEWATLLAEATNQPVAQIIADVEKQRTLTAAEAMEYGLIDEVVEHRPNLLSRAKS